MDSRNQRPILTFLIYLLVLASTTFVYWYVDSRLYNLPDPIILYVLFILLLTLSLGVRIAFLTSVFTVFMVEYFLYEPRYDFNFSDHPISTAYTIIGLIASMVIGYFIRRHNLTREKDIENLKQLVKARDEFASIAAHDLKTPLTTIKLYAESLSRHNSGAGAQNLLNQSINNINTESDKLLEMINRLLDFSRLESNKIAVKKSEVNLKQLVQKQILAVQSIYPDHKFTFTSTVKGSKIIGDPIIIERILTNLLTNAAKYSSPKSVVSVKLSKDKNFYLVSVKDRGRGIEPNQLSRLFEPFYQSDNENNGLGLGLYITKGLIERHGGNISVQSALNKGSTFTVTIPNS